MKRVLSLALSVVMLIGCISGGTFVTRAEPTDNTTYAKIDFTDSSGVKLTNITDLAVVSNGSITPTEITSGVYGAPLLANGNGFSFKMSDIGITAAEIDSGEKQLAITVEYYSTATHGNHRTAFAFGTGKTEMLAMYTEWTQTWDGVPLNRTEPLTKNASTLFTYTLGADAIYIADNQVRYADNSVNKGLAETSFNTKAQALSLVNGETVRVFCQDKTFGYIRSITIYNAEEYTPAESTTDYAYYNFEADNPYYPQYGSSYGMIKSGQTAEPDWVFFKMADSFSAPASGTIAVRFTMKDDATLSSFSFAYNRVVTDTNNKWGNMTAAVTGKSFTYEFTDAAMIHALNHGTDFRVSSEAAEALERVEIHVKGVGMCQHPVTTFVNRVDPTLESEGYEGDIRCKWCNAELGQGNVLPVLQTYAKIDFTDPSGAKTTGVENLAIVGAGSITPVEIADGVYGVPVTTSGNGFSFNLSGIGITPAQIESGEKKIAVSVEYYNNATHGNHRVAFVFGTGKVEMLGMYTSWTQTWDAVPLNRTKPLSQNESVLFTYTLGSGVEYIGDNQIRYADNSVIKDVPETAIDTKAHALALVNGETIRLVSQDKAFGYIRSLTVYDAAELPLAPEEASGTYDYYDFGQEGMPYYPQYSCASSRGMSLVDVVEEPDVTYREDTHYFYWKVTEALVSNTQGRPVAVRFIFKENASVSAIILSYQKALRSEVSSSAEMFADVIVPVTNGEALVLIQDAVFNNELRNIGSIRVRNTDAGVCYQLARVEVHVMADRSELESLRATETKGMTLDSVAAWEAVVAETDAIVNNPMASEEEVAAATAMLQEAKKLLVVCGHDAETTKKFVVEATCYEGGYTGDIYCSGCATLLEVGETVPKHATEIRGEKEATCYAEGYTGDVYCTVCEIVLEAGETIKEKAHKWDDGKITLEPTVEKDGEITYSCKNDGCTATKTEPVARLEQFYTLGDVDGNEKIDSTDARLTLQYAVGKVTASALNVDAADVNGDGKADSTDARLILQLAVGKIQEFPPVD